MNLDTERLRLRPLRDDDLDAYAELCADPEVMCYVKYWGQGLAFEAARAAVLGRIGRVTRAAGAGYSHTK